MDRDLIAKKIQDDYGSLREYAENTLKISEQNLSGKLARLSSKFIKQLKRDGIILEDNSIHDIENSKMVVAQSGKSRGNATENNHFACAYNSDAVKNVMSGYEKSIALLEQWNGELKDEIKNLREEIERLKRRK